MSDYVPAFTCQDCRNVVAEMQRRDDELGEYSVTLPDVRSAIVAVSTNTVHDVDFDHLIKRALRTMDCKNLSPGTKLAANCCYYFDSTKLLTKWERCATGSTTRRAVPVSDD